MNYSVNLDVNRDFDITCCYYAWKRLGLLGMINGFMLNVKTSILVMNRNKFVQIGSRSNDRTKWLTELIDRSL